MGRICNKRELAEILGVSERSLSSWQQEPGFPIVAEAEGRGLENQYDSAAVIGWWLQRELGKSSPSEEERRRLLTAQANLKELELARARRAVVDAAAIDLAIRRGCRVTRDRLLDIASRVAQVLASERSPDIVQRILDKEIRAALTALVELFKAEALAADPQPAAEALNDA